MCSPRRRPGAGRVRRGRAELLQCHRKILWNLLYISTTTLRPSYLVCMTRSVSRNGTPLALAAAIGFACRRSSPPRLRDRDGPDHAARAALHPPPARSGRSSPSAAQVRPDSCSAAWPWALSPSRQVGLLVAAVSTPAAELLFYLSPVIVVAVAICAGARASLRRLGALGIALAASCPCWRAARFCTPTVGIGLALLAALGYAAFVLGADHLLDHLDPFCSSPSSSPARRSPRRLAPPQPHQPRGGGWIRSRRW